jgi:hypothetical protein
MNDRSRRIQDLMVICFYTSAAPSLPIAPAARESFDKEPGSISRALMRGHAHPSMPLQRPPVAIHIGDG